VREITDTVVAVVLTVGVPSTVAMLWRIAGALGGLKVIVAELSRRIEALERLREKSP